MKINGPENRAWLKKWVREEAGEPFTSFITFSLIKELMRKGYTVDILSRKEGYIYEWTVELPDELVTYLLLKYK